MKILTTSQAVKIFRLAKVQYTSRQQEQAHIANQVKVFKFKFHKILSHCQPGEKFKVLGGFVRFPTGEPDH